MNRQSSLGHEAWAAATVSPMKVGFHPTAWGAALGGSNSSHQPAAFRASQPAADVQAARTVSNLFQ
jgi:hypothetical protein